MSNVLVTGGTGFVGHWLNVTAAPDLQLFNLNRHGTPDKLTGFDYVIHLAHVSPAKAIECAKRNNARLLYCSSGIVYHAENDTQYRHEKMQWEAECLASGVDVVIARLFAVWGNRLDDDKAQTIYTKAAKANEFIYLRNGGRTVRSYMHGSEMARWFWAILLRGKSGEAYDVGSDTPITMLDLANQIKKEYHSRSEFVTNNTPEAMPVYVPRDTEKTRRLLT